ncbi:hypothetical protein OSTOST_24097 [Ostertagia ostertagi]
MTSPVKKSKKKSSEGELDFDGLYPNHLDARNRTIDEAQTSTTNGVVMEGGDLATQLPTAQTYMEVAPIEPVDCSAANVHLKV